MITRTERKSIEKSRFAKTKCNEQQGLFEVAFAELWRNAQQRRSAYIRLWIAQVFRQWSPRTKASDDIRATPPLRQVSSP
jgi:hypothetical protein